jgi:excisionase family DNA binding protein
MALTVPETAWELHCHPNTVHNMVRAGQLKSFTLGRKRLIARSALDELIARGGTEVEPALEVGPLCTPAVGHGDIGKVAR